MILVDSSVWIDHFHSRVSMLAGLLETGEVHTHPFIIGELACGTLKNRAEILSLLASLPSAVVATDAETLFFIERHRLMGKGLGYIDVHLLVSTSLTTDARLWTRDKRVMEVATRLRLH